jgi:undecaprenyl-diphosphatase
MLFGGNAMTALEQVDSVLTLSANRFAGRDISLDTLIYDIADSTILKGGVFLAAYWWLWFEVDKEGVPAQRRNVVVALLSGTVAAIASRVMQVALPFHLRPLHTPELGMRVPFGVNATTLNDFSSFPSDHAVLFFALCVPLWKRSRWLGAAAFLWTVLVICLPRVYLGYHWTSDVIAGAVIGIVLMLVLCRLIGATGLPDRVLRFGIAHPPVFYAIAWLLALEVALLFADLRHFMLDAAHIARALV